MKTCLLILALFAAGCSTTVRNSQGVTVLKTYANADIIAFKQGDTSLYMKKMNHSTPTRAGGSVVGTAGSAIVSGITAAAAL